jgi:hypothetical protein
VVAVVVSFSLGSASVRGPPRKGARVCNNPSSTTRAHWHCLLASVLASAWAAHPFSFSRNVCGPLVEAPARLDRKYSSFFFLSIDYEARAATCQPSGCWVRGASEMMLAHSRSFYFLLFFETNVRSRGQERTKKKKSRDRPLTGEVTRCSVLFQTRPRLDITSTAWLASNRTSS